MASSRMSMVITIFVIALIGITFLSTIADETEAATNANNRTDPEPTNVTGASKIITGLIPLFFVLIILVGVFVRNLALRR